VCSFLPIFTVVVCHFNCLLLKSVQGPLIHILLAPKHWQYPFSAIPRYWGPAIQSERGWEYILFIFYFFIFPFPLPTYWQEPFPCHPQVPRIEYRLVSHDLGGAWAAQKGNEKYPFYPHELTVPFLCHPQVRGVNSIQSGKGWSTYSTPGVGSPLLLSPSIRGRIPPPSSGSGQSIEFEGFFLYFFMVPMYWQFLPCRSQVRGFRSSSNMRRVGRSVLIIWMCACWSLPLFPPSPFRPLLWCFPTALTPWASIAAPVKLG